MTRPLHNDLEGGELVNTNEEGSQAAMLEKQASQGPLTQDSDPFNLGPLIFNLQQGVVHGRHLRGKRGRNETKIIKADKRVCRKIPLTLEDG